ncbi:PREDICTED: uncharacterized protein LOC109228090 [Nicotiana attenuata]|uniref:uncharacterized protein LOC109228090 n=1 Tax=Nicotiana attenuata TaxID=49451 RepID=UPI000904C21A|nr:PREDICTED: uncharacterized protein LOC109228090 [Nicotiana attenuata]
MSICGVESEKVEESGKKIGGSGSGEAAEGLVNLARANKKRDAAPSNTTEISLPRGRATRSKLKQSKEELHKALEESEKVTAEVEVQTPKPKKAKTSSKKSTSVPKSVEPSTLAKRTRFKSL